MKIEFKVSKQLYDTIQIDLSRKHAFAAERVGFLYCGCGSVSDNELVIVAGAYQSIPDEYYVFRRGVGAAIDSSAFRLALNAAYKENISVFHVHHHEHFGLPQFSRIDIQEYHKFVPDFFKVRPNQIHGALLFSNDKASGLAWIPGENRPEEIAKIKIPGTILNLGE